MLTSKLCIYWKQVPEPRWEVNIWQRLLCCKNLLSNRKSSLEIHNNCVRTVTVSGLSGFPVIPHWGPTLLSQHLIWPTLSWNDDCCGWRTIPPTVIYESGMIHISIIIYSLIHIAAVCLRVCRTRGLLDHLTPRAKSLPSCGWTLS